MINNFMFRKLFSFLMFVCLIGCSIQYKEANKQAVNKLNNQFKQENYDEIYQQSSNFLKRSISKEEFVLIVKRIREKMKDVDENLVWEEDKNTHFDQSVFRDDNFSHRIMSKNGKKLQIQIDWNSPFRLCGLHVFQNPNESSGIGFRYCN